MRNERLGLILGGALLAGGALVSCSQLDRMPPADPAQVRDLGREELPGGLAHYRFDLRTGDGAFDVVRVHRIVRERAPGRPARAASAVLLLPGAPNFFEAIFMAPSISAAIDRDQSLVAFLASQGVDVWGLDYGWALIPAATADLGFLREWGVERDTRDAASALAWVRARRAAEGAGGGPPALAGFSYGGVVAYAVAGAETARAPRARDVGRLVVLDVGLALEPGPERDYYCELARSERARLDAGTVSDDFGLFAGELGERAIAEPAQPSPSVPGMSNLRAALALGASPRLLNGQFWHFVGGELDAEGIPSGLRFTPERLWLDLLRAVPPHFPMRGNADVDGALCGEVDVSFDDRLGEIDVPILYLGAAGGFGRRGEATARRTASRDVRVVEVQLLGDGEQRDDFGHADLLLAREAHELAWQPILEWLRSPR